LRKSLYFPVGIAAETAISVVIVLLTASQKATKAVTPVPGFRRDRVAGVQKSLLFLDSGFRQNDSRDHFLTFCEAVNVESEENQKQRRGS
jgi:hypothetical protein